MVFFYGILYANYKRSNQQNWMKHQNENETANLLFLFFFFCNQIAFRSTMQIQNDFYVKKKNLIRMLFEANLNIVTSPQSKCDKCNLTERMENWILALQNDLAILGWCIKTWWKSLIVAGESAFVWNQISDHFLL